MPRSDHSSRRTARKPNLYHPPYDERRLDSIWASDERKWLVDQLYLLYHEYRRAFGPTSATTRTVDDWSYEELRADGLAEQENPETNTVGLLLPQREGWYYSPERLVPERVPLPDRPRSWFDSVQPALPVRPMEWHDTPSWTASDLLSEFPREVRERLSWGLNELNDRVIRETTCQRVRHHAAEILDAGITQASKDVEDAERQYEKASGRFSSIDSIPRSDCYGSKEFQAEHAALLQEVGNAIWHLRLLRLRLDWLIRWEQEDAKYRRIFRRNRTRNAEWVVSPRAVAEAEELILDMLFARNTDVLYERLRDQAEWLDVGKPQASEMEVVAIGRVILGQWYRNALTLCSLLPDDLQRIEEDNGGPIPDVVPLRDHATIPEFTSHPILRKVAIDPRLPMWESHPLLSINTRLIRDQRWAAIAHRKAERA